MKSNPNTNSFLKKIYLMCMCILPACVYTYHVHARCPWGPKVGVVSPGSRVHDASESPCGCLEANLGPLQEQ